MLGRLYSAMWPGLSVTAKDSQLQTLVYCSKGPEEAIAQIKPIGNLLSVLLYWVSTSASPGSLVEWQSLSPTPDVMNQSLHLTKFPDDFQPE